MDGHERTSPSWRTDDYHLMRTIYWERRCELAESLLKHVFTKKEIGRACHIHDLEIKVKKLQIEITHQRKAAEYRNRQLEAANLIISCTGGCDDGVIGDKDKVTEEIVSEVERTSKRLRSWWNNYKYRQDRKVSEENSDPRPEPPPAPPNTLR